MHLTMDEGGKSGANGYDIADITNGVAGVDMNNDVTMADSNIDNGIVHIDNGMSMSVDDQEFLDNEAAANNTLIVTNIDEQIFDNNILKREFESLFTHIDDSALCHYLKNFRRARITFSTAELAAEAKACVHNTELCGQLIKCYYAQPIKLKRSHDSPTLHPPVPEKQFLISPPASPPVGWEPVHEGEPVMNYDLLAAMASLVPGQAHQLHPPSSTQPGIVVHVCDDPVGYGIKTIQQTRRPDHH